MELPRRNNNDVYLPDGEFTAILDRLRKRTDAHDLNICIAYAFDFRTRMLPYWYADKRMAPCSVRTLADCLHAAGFKNVRVVLQQWTPNFKPSRARLNGRPLDILMVSAMQVHAEPAYDIVRDAMSMGARRPLILAGGPKAIYEPVDYFDLGPGPGVHADCVSTGEAYVLLDLLERLLENKTADESILSAYQRTRDDGGLDDIPGLVYLPHDVLDPPTSPAPDSAALTSVAPASVAPANGRCEPTSVAQNSVTPASVAPANSRFNATSVAPTSVAPANSRCEPTIVAPANSRCEPPIRLAKKQPDRPLAGPTLYAINTGVQRLLRNLDEMPMPDAGYRLIEPPHRRETLADKPYPAHKVGKLSIVASLISTQGCKFACTYCPIPAVNQRTWRHKSPSRLAAEIKHIYENFGITQFFGTDDNFFNNRQTVVDLMTELAQTTTRGKPLGDVISFFTEATEFDVHKNLDILPLCRKAGLRAIWFGIEDITAELINKGQTPGKTTIVYEALRSLGIEPMAMMIHNDDQPLRSPKDDLKGLVNQARYMFDKGAVSYQCTYLGPAVGTADFEPAAKSRMIFKSVGGRPIPQAYQDGNHVAASKNPRPWERQMNVIRGYATFYNPINTLRVIANWRKDPLAPRRLLFQIIGQIGLLMTFPPMLSWARRLKRGPIEVWDGLQPARIPMIAPATGEQVNWAIEHLPNESLTPTTRRAPVITPKPRELVPA